MDTTGYGQKSDGSSVPSTIRPIPGELQLPDGLSAPPAGATAEPQTHRETHQQWTLRPNHRLQAGIR